MLILLRNSGVVEDSRVSKLDWMEGDLVSVGVSGIIKEKYYWKSTWGMAQTSQ